MAALLLVACSSDDDAGPSTTTTVETTSSSASSTGVDDDPTLEGHLLDAGDLPEGFVAAPGGVDDTITAFCAGEDATAGLSATGRAAVAFTRTPPGASVIQLVFRFEDDDAAAFVAAADAILERCSEVPDFTGLAFTYEPLTTEVADALAGADAAAGRHGTSMGSERLTIDVAVVRHGDVGQLVAVLGVDLQRAELDELARSTFAAALARAAAASGA